ncbi:MAG: four helix bundle protein [Segetibacter sp.]|nr:four helix bundle protein [Segetibacter sp.]
MKKAMMVVKEVYTVTKEYPKEELFALTSQTKRAVVSVPANIAEGVGRNYKKDTIQFLHIARGSLYEVETLLSIALMLEYLVQEKFDQLTALIDGEIRILNGLIKSYKARPDSK